MLLVQKSKISKQIADAIYFFYLFANNFTKVNTWFRKTWAKIPLLHQDQIMIIFKKRILKHANRRAEKKSEITTILNKYQDSPDDLMDSSDAKFLKRPKSKNAQINTI